MKKIISAVLVLVLMLVVSSTAFAVDFTPSVENKAAPTLQDVTYVAEDGTTSDEEDLWNYGYHIVITPVSQKYNAETTKITSFLERAETQVAAAETVADLTVDVEGAFEKYKSTYDEDPMVQKLEIEDLVVADIFDISVVDDFKQHINLPGAFTFALQTPYEEGVMCFLLHNPDAEIWEVVSSAVVDENGILTFTVVGLSPFALIVGSTTEPSGSKPSPQTGSLTHLNIMTAVVVAVFMLAAVLLVTKSCTKKH